MKFQLAPYNWGLSGNVLLEDLRGVAQKLGKTYVTKDEYNRRRFGSYRKALEAFVASFETESAILPGEELEATVVRSSSASSSIRHKTSRNISWRLRFLVMRRDSFKCRLCGASPALKPGTVLVVDHIKPWESGGETEMENLQTLCEPCNGGKSNLPLVEG